MPTIHNGAGPSPSLVIRPPTPRTNLSDAAGVAGSAAPPGRLDRVTTEPARGARFLRQLGAMFDSIVRCFRPARAEGSRLRATQQADIPSRQEAVDAFALSISKTCNTLKSASASAQDIQAVLLSVEDAANELERGDDRPQALLDSLGQTLRSVSDQDLTRVAKTLRGPEVAQAPGTARGSGSSARRETVDAYRDCNQR